MIVQSPCHKCDKRHLHCHSECIAYMNYEHQATHEREMIRRKKKAYADLSDICYEAISNNTWGKR